MPKRLPLPETGGPKAVAISRREVTISSEPGRAFSEARLLPLNLIDQNPGQFRQSFNPETIRELADSIAEQGLLEPIIVRPRDGRFEVVAGERRLRALRLLEEEANPKAPQSVPAIVREMDDAAAALAIATENLQREDFSVADEAVMYERLIDILELNSDRANRELGRQLGINTSRIQRVRRLSRHPYVLDMVVSNAITFMAGMELVATIEQAELERGARQLAPVAPQQASAAASDEEKVRHGDAISPQGSSQAFTTQRVREYERRVPGKVWQPFYSAVRNISQLWEHEPLKLMGAMPRDEVEDIKVKALQAREQLDRLLDGLQKSEAADDDQ